MKAGAAQRARGLELLIEIPAVIVTFVMMIHITANAVLRTWFDNPIDNTLEITEYWYLPLVAFLGFIAAQHRGQHIAADLVYELLPSVTKRFVLALMFVLCALASAGFAKYGWDEAVHAKDIGKTAGVSDLTAWPTYFLAPLAFGSLTVQFLYAAVQAVRHPPTGHVIADTEDAVVLDELARLETEKR
jgi:TRAP-type C4-dicarboxylate transport system permease small subunit